MTLIEKYKTIIASLVGVLLCLAVGMTAGYLQSNSLINWYPFLNRSYVSPPNFIFPIAWGIIYILNGISLGIIWSSTSTYRKSGVILFTIQLFLNFMWSILFFYMQSPILGFINIIILDIALILYMKRCFDINKVAFWLNIPYILWLAFATYLNLYIVVYN